PRLLVFTGKDWVSGEGCWVVVEMEQEVGEKWCYSLAGNHGEQ
nr:hypothetical protein [Tanacetum cinerariifolium]